MCSEKLVRCGDGERLDLAQAVGKVKGEFVFPSTVPPGVLGWFSIYCINLEAGIRLLNLDIQF